MRTLVCLATALLLTGCLTPAERAAQIQREVDEMIVVYGPGCERLGYANGTDDWRNCILRLNERDTRYTRYPTTTSCFGHRGFYQCTTF
jgi:hypothetical protein